MDIQSYDKHKESIQSFISEIKSEEDKINEEIIHFFQTEFIRSYYSDSEESNMETISIDTSPSSERYYSLSNTISSDNISCFKIGDHIREKLSNNTSECEEKKVCPEWSKYFLKTCFCVNDE